MKWKKQIEPDGFENERKKLSELNLIITTIITIFINT